MLKSSAICIKTHCNMPQIAAQLIKENEERQKLLKTN